MQNSENALLKQAEELEKQAKNEVRNKDYDVAISLLLKARDLYSRLSLTGQVGILLKEIVRIKNLKREETQSPSLIKDSMLSLNTKIKMEVNGKEVLELKGNETLEQARKLALDNEFNQSLKLYNDAYDIFKKLNYNYEVKQILWQINQIKEYHKWEHLPKSKNLQVPIKDIVSLAAAERRRQKIQEQLLEKKRVEPVQIKKSSEKVDAVKKVSTSFKLFNQLSEKKRLEEEKKQAELKVLQIKQEQRQQLIRDREEKLRKFREQKQQEKKMQSIAEEYLNKAKISVQRQDFEEAKLNYEKAIEIFNGFGWVNQVKILKQELWNIDRYKKEYERKYEMEVIKRQKSEERFEQRVQTMKSDYKKYQDKIIEKHLAAPPEIKAKLEKIRLIQEKADKEEKLNRLDRVIERYKYILELYSSVPKDIIDLSTEISNIEQKITELEDKV